MLETRCATCQMPVKTFSLFFLKKKGIYLFTVCVAGAALEYSGDDLIIPHKGPCDVKAAVKGSASGSGLPAATVGAGQGECFNSLSGSTRHFFFGQKKVLLAFAQPAVSDTQNTQESAGVFIIRLI